MTSIFVADDERIVLEGISRYLGRLGLPIKIVGTATNGKEALEKCLDLRPDIIITDIKMPQMSGIDFIKELTKVEAYNPRVIAISAYSNFSYAHQLIKNPYVIDYVLKPIDKEELKKTVITAISILEQKKTDWLDSITADNDNKISPESDKEQECIGDSKAVALIVRRVMEYTEKNYMNSDISLAKIANEFYISPNYLSFCFKKEMGIGYTSYLRNYRVEKSKVYLKDVSLKIYEVANNVGFKDSRYYTRIFKEICGVGPKEYRANCE